MPILPSRPRIHLAELRQPHPTRIEALVIAAGRRQRLWFETDGITLAETADPFLPILLPAAMAAGLPLRVEAPVSAEVVAAAHRVSNVLVSWFPYWGELRLEAPNSMAEPSQVKVSGARAAFFSGGVDSFRTLQCLRQQLRSLIFVQGVDIAIEDCEKATLVRDLCIRVAEDVGLSLLTVRSNFRTFTDRWVRWDLHQCGSALAAVALLVRPLLSEVWIPSSYPLPFLHPYGSHPGLEPLWSVPGLQLEHDTLSEGRIEKVQALASWDLARENLRVCWQPGTRGLNCGRCRKCLTTHAVLMGMVQEPDWPTFPQQLDLQALRQVPIHSPDMKRRFLQLRDHLLRTGHHPELLAAVNQLLKNQRRRHLGHGMRQQLLRAHARWH